MRGEAPGNESTSQAKTKRINEVTLRLHETVGAEVGSSLSDMERIPFRSSAAAMDTAVPLFTGDKQIEFRDDFNTDVLLNRKTMRKLNVMVNPQRKYIVTTKYVLNE